MLIITGTISTHSSVEKSLEKILLQEKSQVVKL